MESSSRHMPRESGRQRSSSTAEVYERLRELIVRGRLAPGSRIVESDLAERLGVSRTPVRSALQRLQQEGYAVAINGGKNLRLIIAPLTHEDALELYSIVGQLEGLAARWAAQLEPSVRAELVRDLRCLNEKLLQLATAEGPNTATIFGVHTEFHRRIVEATHAARLQTIHEATKLQAERYRRIYSTASPENVQASFDEHEVIIRSIEAGDSQAAEQALQYNWQRSAERLSRLIQAMGSRGTW